MKLSDDILKFELSKTNSLCINPATGAIDVIPKKFLVKLPDSANKILTKRGYFFSEKGKSLKKLELVYERHSKNVPYWFYILTTLNCNFSCPICYEKRTLKNSETSGKILDKIIKKIIVFQKENQITSNKINLIIFGGEPLCVSNPDILRKILESARQNNWKVVIVTNGTRVENFIDLFVEYSQTISDFRITLDGLQPIHDARRPFRGGGSSFLKVAGAIELLLKNKLPVKMQTILGSGNISGFEGLIRFVEKKAWLKNPLFQWRIESSHDYANLDPEKDEISEGKITEKLINSWEKHQKLHGKIKFESFKYLGHIVKSFGWLGNYKTYWGPKFGFCEPQKGFHYVFSTDGKIYHCPRTINNKDFYLGRADGKIISDKKLKHKTILDKPECLNCRLNTLCGGGCVVQKKYYPNLDCKKYAISVITEFIDLMKKRINKSANHDKIVSINDLW
jgi:uncharacterized protein